MHRAREAPGPSGRNVKEVSRVSPQRSHAKDGRRSRARAAPAKNTLNSMERLDLDESSRSRRADACVCVDAGCPPGRFPIRCARPPCDARLGAANLHSGLQADRGTPRSARLPLSAESTC